MEDMLGLSPRVPKFVKEFGKIGAAIEGAIRGYAEEVRAGTFPASEHTYAVKETAPGVGHHTHRATKKPKIPST